MMHLLFALAFLLLFGATVFTNPGKAITTNLVSGLGGTVPKYVAWGTGAGTSANTDTTLFTEVTTAVDSSYARASGTVSRVTTSVTNDTLQVIGTITAGVALTITNMGLFDALTSGNLYMKTDFTGVALNANDSIQATFKMQYS